MGKMGPGPEVFPESCLSLLMLSRTLSDFAFSSLALDHPRGGWGGPAGIAAGREEEEEEGNDQTLSDPASACTREVGMGMLWAPAWLCPCAPQTWVWGGPEGLFFSGPDLENSLLSGGGGEGERTDRLIGEQRWVLWEGGWSTDFLEKRSLN